ncbi:MAG TPA: prepilin-type N-terminal cleavage/methylation domain-containing protein [Negativicutes bacterium]|nr:prepilin-type N-terminal cleavage/methylation domain-containing protein [Negativicutes bacterium]
MKNQKGFTLVELLVVISIVVVFPAIVMSNFPRVKLQFALTRQAHTFAQELRRTQDRALSSLDFLDEFGLPQAIDGYGIFIDTANLGNTKYVIYADKAPGNQQYDALDLVVATVDFTQSEPGIIIKELKRTVGQTASINFSPPKPSTAITELAPEENSMEVVFAMESDPDNTKSVWVNTSGLIEVK